VIINLYDTFEKRKKEFKPLKKDFVRMYDCGPTVYSHASIGNMWRYLVSDYLRRILELNGYTVKQVLNITDVGHLTQDDLLAADTGEDKIEKAAKKEGKTPEQIAQFYTQAYFKDRKKLNILDPVVVTKATEYIPQMIKIIEGLIKKGFGYELPDRVCFDVEKFKSYGKLSDKTLDQLRSGARLEPIKGKRSPYDFSLWIKDDKHLMKWNSPWGVGYPGWHIECSAMSLDTLGESIDIHSGGEDNIFPHHENEIAQSEGVTGKPLAHYWVHNGFVKINSEKMSKSLNNFFTIRDMLKAYHPEVLRLFLLQSHYRSPVDFSEESLAEARAGMDRLYSTLKQIKDLLFLPFRKVAENPSELPEKSPQLYGKLLSLPDQFSEDMDDDFNTPKALGHIFEAVRLMNGFMADKEYIHSEKTALVLKTAHDILRDLGGVLGLLRADPHAYFRADREREAAKRGFDIVEIETLVTDRRAARKAGNWQKADEIRDILAGKRIALNDSPLETTWKFE